MFKERNFFQTEIVILIFFLHWERKILYLLLFFCFLIVTIFYKNEIFFKQKKLDDGK